jgi:hypothetical protein
MAVQGVCHGCGYASQNLKICNGCYDVSYCSPKCQKLDWKQSHRHVCKRLGKDDSRAPGNDKSASNNDTHGQVATNNDKHGKIATNNDKPGLNDVSPSSCATCGCLSTGQRLMACGGCRDVQYCSKECQQSGWTRGHKRECKSTTSACVQPTRADESKTTPASEPLAIGQRTTFSSIPGDTPCIVCGEMNGTKPCASCKSVVYCSRKCQKAHWKKHKKECGSIDGIINTDGIITHSANAFGGSNIEFGESGLDPSMNLPGRMGKGAKPSPIHYASAKKAAQRLFASESIIEDLDNVPMEIFGLQSPEYGRGGRVLLALMSRFHDHWMRHGVYLQVCERRIQNEFIANYYFW